MSKANEALDRMAENARELGLDYEPDGMHHNKPQKRPQNCGTGYCSCIECVMEPAVPDAIGPNEDELPAYAAGWNDCRQAMLEIRKPAPPQTGTLDKIFLDFIKKDTQ